MPRLSPELLKHARQTNPLLVPLLRACRDLISARNELRWLGDHAVKVVSQRKGSEKQNLTESVLLKYLCEERGRGRPLQYLLGTEYFGELELLCRPGVLIPRPETADITTALANRLLRIPTSKTVEVRKLPPKLRILDLCAGTGCMSLLLSHLLLSSSKLPEPHSTTQVLGIDISARAIHLARANLSRLRMLNQLPPESASTQIAFAQAHILSDGNSQVPTFPQVLRNRTQTTWDVLISNPPYISPSSFWNRTTGRSVRGFEPRLALVPGGHNVNFRNGIVTDASGRHRGDEFFPRLLDIATQVNAKVVLMEVGEIQQAVRVANMALEQNEWDGVEIWRDGVGFDGFNHDIASAEQDETDARIKILGRAGGDGRAVVCWRGEGGAWMKP